MKNVYMNSIRDNIKKQISNNAAQTRYDNRIVFQNHNARENTVNKTNIKPAINPNRYAFGTNSDSNRTSTHYQAEDESAIYSEEIGEKPYQPDFSLNKENVLNGIIFSEILGKPRSKKKGL